MYKEEAEVVNEDFVKRRDNYNVASGGHGGFTGRGSVTVRDKDGKTFNVKLDDPKYLSGEFEHISRGFVTVRDKRGKAFNVKVGDERIKSGELEHVSKGTLPVKDKSGKCFRVQLDDPRIESGELVHATKGTKRTKECKLAQSKAKLGKIQICNKELNIVKLVDKGEKIPCGWTKGNLKDRDKHYYHGKIWIKNPLTRECDRIPKDSPIPEGWERGRITPWMYK